MNYSETKINCKIVYQLYESVEGDFRILKCRHGKESIMVCGNVGDYPYGTTINAYGKWVNKPKYGWEFKAKYAEEVYSATENGIERYLASAGIEGISKSTAKKIVGHFGKDTFRILEESPERIKEVPRLRKSTIEKAIQSVKERTKDSTVVRFLMEHGMDHSPAVAIAGVYKRIEDIKANPYGIISKVKGVGFVIMDKFAHNIGIAATDPNRLAAGVVHTLEESKNKGNCFLPKEKLIKDGARLLGVNQNLMVEAIPLSEKLGLVVVEDECVYLPGLYHYEKFCAKMMTNLMGEDEIEANPEEECRQWENLDETQRDAVRAVLKNKISIITGGPGTGKTYTMGSIFDIFEGMGKNVLLAAPTGRAAKQLQFSIRQATNHKAIAMTIHKLLEAKYDPNKNRFFFSKNQNNPLEGDLLIVDESSMIGLDLFYYLLLAIPQGMRLLFVGDVDQLPSVSPGKVFSDLIGSGLFSVSRLTTIHRQDGSEIPRNAARVNHGQLLETEVCHPFDLGSPLEFCEEEDVMNVVRQVTSLEKYKADPYEVQVLAPKKKGDFGTIKLNSAMQAYLNPPKIGERSLGIAYEGDRFELRKGDRVMQTRNNYNHGVMNGDMGIVTKVEDHIAYILFDGFENPIPYSFGDSQICGNLGDIIPAYAITVHKSQGSEFPIVIMPLSTSHNIMLKRNLLYTAMTRAKDQMVIVGESKALWQAIQTPDTSKRFTLLENRLRKCGQRESFLPY